MPTATRRCSTCKTLKLLAEFPLYGTRRRAVCTPCSEARAAAPSPAKASALSLQRPAGFGFTASLEDGRLVIEQESGDGRVDNITLARHEARELIDWIAEVVGR